MVWAIVGGRTGKEKWTHEAVAKHCHVSRRWVTDVIAESEGRTANSPKLPHPPTPTKTEAKRERVEAAIAAADPDASGREIARKLGVDEEERPVDR